MVCFDTMVVLWGIQSYAGDSQHPMINRTKRYLRELSEEGKSIMIPAPVVFECLTSLSDEEMRVQQMLMESSFFIPAFDMAASVEAARLMGNKEAVDRAKNIGAKRENLKVDAQIAAIAILNGAEKIISHDSHMKTIAQDRISVEEIPEISEQLNLLGENS